MKKDSKKAVSKSGGDEKVDAATCAPPSLGQGVKGKKTTATKSVPPEEKKGKPAPKRSATVARWKRALQFYADNLQLDTMHKEANKETVGKKSTSVSLKKVYLEEATQQWSELSEHDQVKYTQLETDDRERYVTEVEAWNEANPDDMLTMNKVGFAQRSKVRVVADSKVTKKKTGDPVKDSTLKGTKKAAASKKGKTKLVSVEEEACVSMEADDNAHIGNDDDASDEELLESDDKEEEPVVAAVQAAMKGKKLRQAEEPVAEGDSPVPSKRGRGKVTAEKGGKAEDESNDTAVDKGESKKAGGKKRRKAAVVENMAMEIEATVKDADADDSMMVDKVEQPQASMLAEEDAVKEAVGKKKAGKKSGGKNASKKAEKDTPVEETRVNQESEAMQDIAAHESMEVDEEPCLEVAEKKKAGKKPVTRKAVGKMARKKASVEAVVAVDSEAITGSDGTGNELSMGIDSVEDEAKDSVEEEAKAVEKKSVGKKAAAKKGVSRKAGKKAVVQETEVTTGAVTEDSIVAHEAEQGKNVAKKAARKKTLDKETMEADEVKNVGKETEDAEDKFSGKASGEEELADQERKETSKTKGVSKKAVGKKAGKKVLVEEAASIGEGREVVKKKDAGKKSAAKEKDEAADEKAEAVPVAVASKKKGKAKKAGTKAVAQEVEAEEVTEVSEKKSVGKKACIKTLGEVDDNAVADEANKVAPRKKAGKKTAAKNGSENIESKANVVVDDQEYGGEYAIAAEPTKTTGKNSKGKKDAEKKSAARRGRVGQKTEAV